MNNDFKSVCPVRYESVIPSEDLFEHAYKTADDIYALQRAHPFLLVRKRGLLLNLERLWDQLESEEN